MADSKAPAERPLSPHLFIYKLTLTMMMSIAHRLTGVALYFGTLLIAWWLLTQVLFPVRLRDFPCNLTVHDVDERHSFSVGGLQVESALVIHPDGAVGYRVTEAGRSMAFLPDHEPALGASTFPIGPEWTSGYELCTDVDLLVHDAQYTDEEYAMKVGWGHSTFEHVLAFAELVRARHLVTFHHDPSHTDTMLDEKAEEIRRRLPGRTHVLPIVDDEGRLVDYASGVRIPAPLSRSAR